MADLRIRATPRISVNKLAEYMVATPARRRGIIRDQKVRREVVVARYQEVYSAIAEYLADSADVGPVYRRLDKLYSATAKSAWELQNNQLSAEALEWFLSFVDEIDLSQFETIRAAQTLPLMDVAGVGVSVKPSVLLRVPGTSRVAGAVHIYLSKLFAFDDEAAAYAGAVVHQFVDTVLEHGNHKVDPANSYVIDVFARRIHVGPRAYKRRRKDIEAACEEIAQRWAAV
jgi:hypothetical protein